MDTNEYLQPLDAPVTTHDNVTGFEFDTTSDRGMVNSFQIKNASIGSAKIGTASINTAQVGTISFNKISGGTATLGGTTNGNGLLSVKNSGGTEIVRADNTGLTVSNGSITIQDSSGSSVIDASGLNSLSSFLGTSFTTSGGTNFTTTSDSFVDVTSATLSFVTQRSTNVLVGANFYGKNTAASDVLQAGALARILVDGTTYGGFSYINGLVTGAGNYFSSGAINSIVTVSSGTHTMKLQLARDFGAGTALIQDPQMYCVILGK